MDPIHPIAPRPAGVPSPAALPVERLERISRERDRSARERRNQPRREPPAGEGEERPDEDGHIDVRV